MMADARRGRFDLVLVWASDRLARSVKHFLEVLDELNHLNVEFVSYREQIDTGGPLGRAIIVIVGAVAEFERNLIVERVRAGMRRAKLEGRHIGRKPLDLDRIGILRDRSQGLEPGPAGEVLSSFTRYYPSRSSPACLGSGKAPVDRCSRRARKTGLVTPAESVSDRSGFAVPQTVGYETVKRITASSSFTETE